MPTAISTAVIPEGTVIRKESSGGIIMYTYADGKGGTYTMVGKTRKKSKSRKKSK